MTPRKSSCGDAAEVVWTQSSFMPELVIREGKVRDVLRDVIENDPDVTLLVVGASASKEGPGPIVTALTNTPDYLGARPIPLLIIPGMMTREEIARVA